MGQPRRRTGSRVSAAKKNKKAGIRGGFRRGVAGATTLLLSVSLAPALTAPAAVAAPVGQGFNLNASDLRHIFRQIQISEHHVANPGTSVDPCASLIGPGDNQIPGTGNSLELPWGLRTVDGSCNNLLPGRDRWGAADSVFPRMVEAAPRGAYANPGTVTDTGPRMVSNLIVDQSPANPAAVAAAGTDEVAPDDGDTLFIPNSAPDVGLSAPFNSWFTLFGQFFDHGLDLVTKGGNGLVMMPLAADDPLVLAGPDGDPDTTDDNVPVGTPMLLSRTTNVTPGGGSNEARNTTTPYVDQNQTYTSHPSHQVFLRQYEMVAGRPVDTGRLLTSAAGGMATWADVKDQARTMLGIELGDLDVLNVPVLKTDLYGHFVRATNGLPQMVKTGAPGGLEAGDLDNPITTAGATRTGHAFLDDIAHHAVPRTGFTADPDTELTPDLVQCQPGGVPAGCVTQYDDEMLEAHFMAGDGRTNENIGLTAVHHIFHSEHNRLRNDINDMITGPDAVLTAAEAAAWQSVGADSGWGYGERLFQAARFVTEMEYQHLVFEEFARKVQPMVNVFGEGGTGYHTEVNADINAEFAHAVYRFGHSMLTEHVTRTKADGTDDSERLLDVFLNPPAFLNGYATPDEAAGAVVRGMTRQSGNEIDEFVTGALRNNLLGLPLDLATINLARARDTGIPTLNEARRSFYAESGNTQLQPYASWADLSFSLKHQESLVNFVAAFGTHPSVTGTDLLAARRTAAARLVYGEAGPDAVLGDVPTTAGVDEGADDLTDVPADRIAFMNGTDDWANEAGRTTTGVDDIDLWVGGLAEKQMVFGGMLGSTFNYVFEKQMEDLQDGDRFYYLTRTAGLNLLTQLEGNSLSELVMRNTDLEGLPADSFSRPDLVFNIGEDGSVLDNPETPDLNETSLITRMADGTNRFGGGEHVVFNGRDTGLNANDRIWSSEGDDTVRGNGGDDWVQGGDGNDNLIGGLGDDTLLDLNGDDTIKGGDGDDIISSGPGGGGDLNQGGRGKDYIIGGNDITETFAGAGDDFVFAGDSQDTVFGDDGDDWIEGGRGAFNLLQGDNGAPFANDINEAGHDVLIGYGGETDYDAEGGDDIMLAGPGIQRNEGMRGFDWVTHQDDPRPADSDMDFTGLLPPTVENNRDRFDLVEALSGYNFDDTLRGDDRVAADFVNGEESHVLTPEGINRINGLADLVDGALDVDGNFSGGNILIGGGGADIIEGRAGDDIIDGDAQLTVELRAVYRNGTVRTVRNMSQLNADVLAGLIDPGEITIVRRIETIAAGADTALFTGPADEYTITGPDADGWITVSHTGGTAIDGTDRLRNIDTMLFEAGTPRVDTLDVPDAPTLATATAAAGQATVSFTQGADGGSPVTGFRVLVFEDGATVPFRVVNFPSTSTNATITGLIPGVTVRLAVVSVNLVGPSVQSAQSAPLTPLLATPPSGGGTTPTTGGGGGGESTGPGSSAATPPAPATTTPPPAAAVRLTAPDAPKVRPARSGRRGGQSTAIAKWKAPAADGGSQVTGYRVLAYKIGGNGRIKAVVRSGRIDAGLRKTTMVLPSGLYQFRVVAINANGRGDRSARSNVVRSR